MSTDVASSTHAALRQSRFFCIVRNIAYLCKSLNTTHRTRFRSVPMRCAKQYQDMLTLPEELLDVKERVAVHVTVFGLRVFGGSYGNLSVPVL